MSVMAEALEKQAAVISAKAAQSAMSAMVCSM